MSHITGGGLLENLPRMYPQPGPDGTDGPLAALIERDSWHWPELFSWLQQAGNVAEDEMLRTFNCGIGYVLCVPAAEADAVLQTLQNNAEVPVHLGTMVPADTKPGAGQLLIA